MCVYAKRLSPPKRLSPRCASECACKDVPGAFIEVSHGRGRGVGTPPTKNGYALEQAAAQVRTCIACMHTKAVVADT